MSQDYTPVSWVDETTSQQGTLINAERLNQMQTAHHYADGFEEVDAIPTEDPGVAYHKIVYCTADATFYRWDGTQWAADIDEDTKHLLDQEIARAEHAEGLIQGYLDAHEANHNNPHQVTKAQVGLGNCDNTADLDKPISTAAQAALDTKADKATTLAGYGITDAYTKTEADTLLAAKADKADVYDKTAADTLLAGKVDKLVSSPAGTYKSVTVNAQGQVTAGTNPDTLAGYGITDAYTKTEADTLLASKADTTALTDGSVTKLGTADLGTDTKPIKLVAGVPTAVTNDLVSTSGNQTVGGVKTLTDEYGVRRITGYIRGGNSAFWKLAEIDNNGNNLAMVDIRDDKTYRGVHLRAWDDSGTNHTALQTRTDAASGDTWVQAVTRGYNAAYTADVATIGTLDGYSPMVRTSGNQEIGGNKILTGETIISGTFNNKCKYYGLSTAANNYERIATLTPGILGGTFVGMIYSTKGHSAVYRTRCGIFYARTRNTDLNIVWLIKGSTIVEKQLCLTYDGSKFELWGLVNYDAANEALGFTVLSESNAGVIPYNLVHVDNLDVVKTEAELSQYQLTAYSS